MTAQAHLFPDKSSVSLDIHGLFSDSLREASAIKNQKQHIAAVKKLLQNHMAVIRSSNRKRDAGEATVRYLTETVDTLIRIMWDQLELNSGPEDKPVALVAIGGYGRMELCPQSDIDLLILTSEKISQSERLQAETIIRDLWDYGFDAGPSVRSISQCGTAMIKEPETSTSFLSERFLAGNHQLYQNFLKVIQRPLSFWRNSCLVKFILDERKARTRKFGGLIQLLEPNLKEGNGCLRDVQMIRWLGRLKFGCRNLDDLIRKGLISPQDLEDIRSGYRFLLQVRCCLHFLTDKKDDILVIHLQPKIAEEIGFSISEDQQPVEMFMQSFYRHMKAVNRITEAFISRWEKPFPANRTRIKIKKHPFLHETNGTLELKSQSGNPFRNNVAVMLDYFDYANRTGLVFGNHALLRIKQAVKAINLNELRPSTFIHTLLDLCKRQERVGRMLRAMHDVELLQLIIPDFRHLRFHTQHNMYHIYTTDEHTLTAVRQLAYLKDRKGKHLLPIQEALSQVNDLDVLILACFFHDIGKGFGGDHCKTGAKKIYDYMKKTGFSTNRCQEASKLVLHHLAMNEIAQRRNLDDPHTIIEFKKKVQFPETLHKLYVLTYCDISSVHPDAWSDWKASLLQTLYCKTLESMKKPVMFVPSSEDTEKLLLKNVSAYISENDIRNHVSKMPEDYIYSTGPDELTSHIMLANKLNNRRFVFQLDKHDIHYKLIIAAADNPKLLLSIAASLAEARLNILSAKIYTRTDNIAIDEFNLEWPESQTFDMTKIRKKLEKSFTKYFTMFEEPLTHFPKEITPLRSAPRVMKPLHVPVGVEFSNLISKNFSTIDISCRDQIGLMYSVTRVFAELKINVHSAILTTEAEVAMDAFYVTDLTNRKIEDENKISRIIKRLKEELIN
jgi:[protein-PII] uridylyltransferase